MEAQLQLAAQQLARMRGMTALYHKRFFADTRFVLLMVLALLAVGFLGAPQLFAAVPLVALLGACQTAFDASYLIFARQYAASLERYLNRQVGEEVLVAARLEDAYLFPLDRRKVVTLAFGEGFSWFGFMTALYTVTGVLAYVTGVVLAVPVLRDEGAEWLAPYLVVLGVLTAAALGAGLWWFVSGAGERRLRRVLDEAFGPGS